MPDQSFHNPGYYITNRRLVLLGSLQDNLSGHLTHDSLAVSRKVLALHREAGLVVSASNSASDGYYCIRSLPGLGFSKEKSYMVIAVADQEDDFKSVLGDKITPDYDPDQIVDRSVLLAGFDAGKIGSPGLNVPQAARDYGNIVSDSKAWFTFDVATMRKPEELTYNSSYPESSAVSIEDVFRRGPAIYDIVAAAVEVSFRLVPSYPSSLAGKGLLLRPYPKTALLSTGAFLGDKGQTLPFGSTFSVSYWCTAAAATNSRYCAMGMSSGDTNATGWYLLSSGSSSPSYAPEFRIFNSVGTLFSAKHSAGLVGGASAAHLISFGVDAAAKKLWIQVDGATRVETTFTGDFAQDPNQVFSIGRIGYDQATDTYYQHNDVSAALAVAASPQNLTVNEMGIFDRVLTPAEHTFLYNSGAGRYFSDYLPQFGPGQAI